MLNYNIPFSNKFAITENSCPFTFHKLHGTGESRYNKIRFLAKE